MYVPRLPPDRTCWGAPPRLQPFYIRVCAERWLQKCGRLTCVKVCFSHTFIHTHAQSSYLLGTGFLFPPLGGLISQHATETEKQTAVQWGFLLLPSLMHKYHCVKGHKTPSGQDLESAHNLLNLNLNLCGEVAPKWPPVASSPDTYHGLVSWMSEAVTGGDVLTVSSIILQDWRQSFNRVRTMF